MQNYAQKQTRRLLDKAAVFIAEETDGKATMQAIADRFAIGLSAVYEWRRSGAIPTKKLKNLMEYLDSKKIKK